MVLVNGADGIGTGWSTNIPNFNPRDLVANIKRMLNGLEPLKMNPWYKGFKGTIEQGGAPDDFTVAGIIARNEVGVFISEVQHFNFLSITKNDANL